MLWGSDLAIHILVLVMTGRDDSDANIQIHREKVTFRFLQLLEDKHIRFG